MCNVSRTIREIKRRKGEDNEIREPKSSTSKHKSTLILRT